MRNVLSLRLPSIAAALLAALTIHSTAQTIQQRIDQLVSRMTLEEKILQINQDVTAFGTVNNARLGIPGFRMADGPHGVREGTATSFPVGIGMAATWDVDLTRRIGVAMGKEFRGKGKNQALGPCLDLDRDPRNGRSPETGGEDPYLDAQITTSVVKGLQSTPAIATIKHYNANHRENGRMTNNIIASQRMLHDHNGLTFRTAVQEGGAFSVMNAYNLINGEKCAENRNLLTDILRTDWGFPYYIVSDWGAVWSAEKAIKAGTDICMGSDHYKNDLAGLVGSGAVPIATIDSAVRRVLWTKFASGVMNYYPPGDPADVNSVAHRQLCLEAARKSFVLLKNQNYVLPLASYLVNTVAVVGPNAAVTPVDGGGSAYVTPQNSVSPKQGIETRLGAAKVRYAKGCDINSVDTSGFAEARNAAYLADYVIFVGGLDPSQESEGMDRANGSTALPGKQQDLINTLAATNPKMIIVIYSGGICTLNSSIDKARALIYGFYPGQESGTALAEILLGDVNPSGKLPVTMPMSDAQLPAWDDDFNNDYGGGYRWYDKTAQTPRYAFGFGLTYTTFVYTSFTVSPSTVSPGEPVTVQVNVANLGGREGDDIVQMYVTHPSGSSVQLVKQLKGFKRVALASGQNTFVTFTLSADELYSYNETTNRYEVEPGEYTVRIGGSSDNLPLSKTFTVVAGTLKPDLRVTSIRPIPRYPLLGEEVAFAATVKNQGTAVVSAGTILRTQFLVDGSPVAWADTLRKDILPGGMVFMEAQTGPSGNMTWTATSVGSHPIEARVDVNGAVNEFVESNNSLMDTLLVYIPPLPNVAKGKVATCSSTESASYGAGNAVDGDLGTRWSSAFTDPQWIQVDLGSRYHLDEIVIQWENAYAKDYLVIVYDGDTARVAANVTNSDGGIDILPTSVMGSKVKIIGTQRATAWGYSIYEIEVHGQQATAINDSRGLIPSEPLRLEGIYPNPFNPSTMIRYDLADRSRVRLTIYDMLGRGVALLTDAEQEGGVQEVRWDATGHPSGIYVCRVEAISRSGVRFSQSRKMVLLQ
jgi:beta-glucosidase